MLCASAATSALGFTFGSRVSILEGSDVFPDRSDRASMRRGASGLVGLGLGLGPHAIEIAMTS